MNEKRKSIEIRMELNSLVSQLADAEDALNFIGEFQSVGDCHSFMLGLSCARMLRVFETTLGMLEDKKQEKRYKKIISNLPNVIASSKLFSTNDIELIGQGVDDVETDQKCRMLEDWDERQLFGHISTLALLNNQINNQIQNERIKPEDRRKMSLGLENVAKTRRDIDWAQLFHRLGVWGLNKGIWHNGRLRPRVDKIFFRLLSGERFVADCDDFVGDDRISTVIGLSCLVAVLDAGTKSAMPIPGRAIFADNFTNPIVPWCYKNSDPRAREGVFCIVRNTMELSRRMKVLFECFPPVAPGRPHGISLHILCNEWKRGALDKYREQLAERDLVPRIHIDPVNLLVDQSLRILQGF